MTKPLTPEVRARIIAMAHKAVNDNRPTYFNHLNTALSSSMHGDD